MTGQVKAIVEADIRLFCESKKCEIHEMGVQVDRRRFTYSTLTACQPNTSSQSGN